MNITVRLDDENIIEVVTTVEDIANLFKKYDAAVLREWEGELVLITDVSYIE